MITESRTQTETPGCEASLTSEYLETGYVLLHNAVDHAELSAAADSLRERQARAEQFARSDRYNKAGRVDFSKIPNLAKQDETFRRLASSPAVVEAIELLLGRQALLFRDVMVVKPARDGAHLDYHQDSEYWDIQPRALISAWFPFRDIGVDDGCLRVIPGSHRSFYRHDILLGEDRALPDWMTTALRRMATLAGTGDSDASGFSAARKLKNSLLGEFTRNFNFLANLQDLHARVSEKEKQKAVDLPVRKGSVILFHSLLLHASNANTSDADRLAYIPSYMGTDYTFHGVGEPEFLVARERERKTFRKVKVART